MKTLLDIADTTRAVTIGDDEIEVRGVSARGVIAILRRFPAFGALVNGKAGDLDAQTLIDHAPDAVAALIAAGAGFPGNDQAEAKADGLPAPVQIDLLEAIVSLTLPEGLDPFLDRLAGLMDRAGLSEETEQAQADGKAAS